MWWSDGFVRHRLKTDFPAADISSDNFTGKPWHTETIAGQSIGPSSVHILPLQLTHKTAVWQNPEILTWILKVYCKWKKRWKFEKQKEFWKRPRRDAEAQYLTGQVLQVERWNWLTGEGRNRTSASWRQAEKVLKLAKMLLEGGGNDDDEEEGRVKRKKTCNDGRTRIRVHYCFIGVWAGIMKAKPPLDDKAFYFGKSGSESKFMIKINLTCLSLTVCRFIKPLVELSYCLQPHHWWAVARFVARFACHILRPIGRSCWYPKWCLAQIFCVHTMQSVYLMYSV